MEVLSIKYIFMKLKGKVAIVTGGARDLGRAISVKLASEGAKVVINYFDNPEDALETLKMVQESGSEGIIVQGDMTKADDVKRLFDEGIKSFGNEIHVLVNVVGGIVGRKTITEQDEDWYQFLMDVNMKSCWLCTREAVPYMPEGSAIVNFSSLAARDGGGPGASLYATAKGAVMTFTRLWPKNLVLKEFVSMHWLREPLQLRSTIVQYTRNRERMKGIYPLRREGDAGDVADLVLFLASADSDYLTGTNIDINGGMAFYVSKIHPNKNPCHKLLQGFFIFRPNIYCLFQLIAKTFQLGIFVSPVFFHFDKHFEKTFFRKTIPNLYELQFLLFQRFSAMSDNNPFL